MKTTRYSYSAFLRGPTSVLPALETGDVVLERREETNLVLTIEPRAAARAEGMAMMGRLLAHLQRERPEVLAELLGRELPWLNWLPAEERHQALHELVFELTTGAVKGLLDRFGFALREWLETALIWSDSELARRLRGPFPGDGPVLSSANT